MNILFCDEAAPSTYDHRDAMTKIITTALIPATDTEPMTTDEHLSAAGKLIRATAQSIHDRHRREHGKKDAKARRNHLDAACNIAQAGEALYMVAEMLAEGQTRGSYQVQLYMRIAEAKQTEALARMAGTGRS